jgi:hypothetical protein
MLIRLFSRVGHYKDLRDKGLLSKEGGFLGIGRLECCRQFDESIFTKWIISE